MNTSSKELDRARGAMVGLAVGDALGVPLHGMERDWIKPVRDMIGGGLDNSPPGDWTESTSLALGMGFTMIHEGLFKASAIMRTFSLWRRDGEFCPSGKIMSAHPATLESIKTFEETGSFLHPNITAIDASAIARTAPVVLMYRGSPSDCHVYAGRQCALTHGNHIPVEISRHLSLGLRNAIIGRGKDQVLAGFDALTFKIGKWRDLNRDKIKVCVPAIDVFKAALWSIDVTNNFEEAVIVAVNLAGDSNVLGAIVGQLAGALYGYESIPKRWLDQVAWLDVLSDTATKLYEGGK